MHRNRERVLESHDFSETEKLCLAWSMREGVPDEPAFETKRA
jgi:hypothetical protein